MRLAKQAPVAPIPLEVGDRVTLLDGGTHRWDVRAVTEHFAALTRRMPNGATQYTVLDWRNGVRGPCNLIGQGYGEGTYDDLECAAMLAEFEDDDLEVSYRNRVALDVVAVNGEPVQLREVP
jgi:hypothetical protein